MDPPPVNMDSDHDRADQSPSWEYVTGRLASTLKKGFLLHRVQRPGAGANMVSNQDDTWSVYMVSDQAGQRRLATWAA